MRTSGGRFKGRVLPEAREARPAPGRWKGSLFAVLEPFLEGARVLDLFAGIGGLGLEALSRGAARVVLVERDGRAAAELEGWIEHVGATREAEVQRRDALHGSLPAGPFDLVFADPPFSVWDGAEGAALIARTLPLLVEGGVLVLKMPTRRDVPEDPGWHVVRRRTVGSVAWAILRAGPAPATRPHPDEGPESGAATGPEAP